MVCKASSGTLCGAHTLYPSIPCLQHTAPFYVLSITLVCPDQLGLSILPYPLFIRIDQRLRFELMPNVCAFA